MPILHHRDLFILQSRRTAYAFGLNATGLLTHCYWGERLPFADDYPAPANPGAWGPFNNPAHLTPEEFPGYEDMKYIEPCLKVTQADGVRDVSARYVGHTIEGETLKVVLRDVYYPLEVTLHYRVLADYDLIERRVTLHNRGDEAMVVERAFSAQWHLPVGDRYRLTHLHGRWFDEMHIERLMLPHGVTVLESRRLTSSHHHVPWFAVDGGQADEEQGAVWFGLLDWSGNWKLAAEVTDFASTRVSIGLNDWDFAWRLEGGETLTTPVALGGFSSGGFGAVSRIMHDYVREVVMPHPEARHKVFYNSWEATLFDVEAESQMRLAELAADLGAEMFMIDDGWYRGRTSQSTGLGDWEPDATKFPDGLEQLIAQVNGLGMDFGLWFEPEMVNPDSDLYRAHPDWVIVYPTREKRLGRDALHLNLARRDVQDYVIGALDRMLSRYAIRYAKWDMNRNVSEPGWPEAMGAARELWVRYVEGLYRVWETIRLKHPDVIWQSCSGGGGRTDLGMLRVSDVIWVSDNSGGAYRLTIQEGYSLMFPAATMQTWVTDQQPKVPLHFRFHSAMCGMMGIGADIRKWDEATRDEARRWIALYKEIMPVVQQGDLYRLRPADESGFCALAYVSKDQREGVLFAFRTYVGQHEPSLTVRLRGLQPEWLYSVEGFEGVRSGKAWMNLDLQFGLYGGLDNLDSTVRRIKQV